MKFSIVTVTYNSAVTLKETIDSVINQSFEDYEYIIVDGNSSDSTIDIIKEYEPKFKGRMRWISEPDKGLYDAMNKGFKMAEGEVIMIINSDDIICKNDALQIIANKFNENPNIDAIYANLYYVSRKNTNKIIRAWTTGIQKEFKKGWLPAHPTFYAKRSVYLKYGYFNTNFKLAADFELMLRFIEKYKISLLYLNEYLVKMRLGGESSKNIINIFKQNLECMRAFKENNLDCSILYPFYRLLPKVKQFFL